MIEDAHRIDALAQAIASPGESWTSATTRAVRLLGAARPCVPCPDCNSEDDARPWRRWIDDGAEACRPCRADWDDCWDAGLADDESLFGRPAPAPLGQGERPCRACGAAAVPFGLFCPACYGEWLHPEGLPMEPGDPADPWRAFNAEADALILDRQMPAFLREPVVPTPPRPPAQNPPCNFDDE